MATVKKKIGRVPVYRGEYDSRKSYSMHNIVSYMNSSFISTMDGNTSAPCTMDGGNLVLNNGWQFMADSSYAYKLVLEKEVDIPQFVFDKMKEDGELDTTKDYYTYEEE